MTQQLSPQQQTVIDWIENGSGSANVEARAGSGKTTLLRAALLHMRGNVFVGAYNRAIADEFKSKIGPQLRDMEASVDIRTFHSAGMRVCGGLLPGRANVFNYKTSTITNKLSDMDEGQFGELDQLVEEYREQATKKHIEEHELPENCTVETELIGIPSEDGEEGKPKPSKFSLGKMSKSASRRKRSSYYWIKPNYGRFISKAVSLAKQSAFGVPGGPEGTDEDWEDLATHHDLSTELKGQATTELGLRLSRLVLDLSVTVAESDSTIDYDDMIYLPLLWEASLTKYDWVLIDECFVGDTPILLGDGTLKPIRELVESRYSGNVMSYQNGKAVSRPIVNWHRLAVRGNMVRLTVRRVGRRENGKRFSPVTERIRYGNRVLMCTDNHRFLSGDRWVEAGTLKVGDKLVIESAAPKDYGYNQRWKHGNDGRKHLSRLMSAKNEEGVCGGGVNGEGFTRRGGNGTGPSPVEAAILERLGDEWKWNYVVTTGPDHGHPNHYKIDLAHPERMVALEMDGNSHQSPERQKADRRKDAFLEAAGWTVVRLTNQQAMGMTDELLHETVANSPVEAEVVAMESWEPREPWVYDITVKDTHCYFANGVLAHNCQDVNVSRRIMAMRMMREGGRLLGVGDSKQAIYGFCGADSESMTNIAKELDSQTFPLTMTYRCGSRIVEEAQEVVPDIQAHEANGEGVVRKVEVYEDMLAELQHLDGHAIGDCSILCRNMKPLVETCYSLMKRQVPVRIEGQDLADRLLQTIKDRKQPELHLLLVAVEDYRREEVERLKEKDRWGQAGAVDDICDAIKHLGGVLHEEGARDTEELVKLINTMFAVKRDLDKLPPQVLLATIHRSKGREWKRVYFLGYEELIPSKWARLPWQLTQEDNLKYVAITRAMEELVYVPLREKEQDQRKREAKEEALDWEDAMDEVEF